MTHSKILAMIQEKGPALPIEVASFLGVDSFMAKVLLSELVEQGALKISDDQVGSSYVYFMLGQESSALEKVKELLKGSEKKLKHFSDKPVSNDPEIQKKREAFEKHFEKALTDEPPTQKPVIKKPARVIIANRELLQEKPFIVSKPITLSPETPPIIIKPAPLQAAAQFVKKVIAPAPQPKRIEDFVELASTYLKGSHAEILETNITKKGKEADLIVNIPSSIGTVRFFAKVKSKKKINDADISLAYTDGAQRKLPVLFITDGKLASAAKELLDKLEGYMKVKFLTQ